MSALPSYSYIIMVLVIVANVATVWIVLLTMGAHNGELFSGGPPWLAALSCLALVLCYYNILVPIEVSFWGSAFLSGMGLWGSWVDYTHLSDHRKAVAKSRSASKSPP